jgi:hypothetical protein
MMQTTEKVARKKMVALQRSPNVFTTASTVISHIWYTINFLAYQYEGRRTESRS